jgi:hypothetical protein
MSHERVGSDELRATDLIGTWRLRSWVSRAQDGSLVEPFGPAPLGYVVYTAEGRMITTISPPDGSHRRAVLEDAPTEAPSAALDSFIAYSGAFRVAAGDVIHSVEMSLKPDWVGSEQLRHVELSAERDRLILSSDPIEAGGRLGRHVLTWERVRD